MFTKNPKTKQKNNNSYFSFLPAHPSNTEFGIPTEYLPQSTQELAAQTQLPAPLFSAGAAWIQLESDFTDKVAGLCFVHGHGALLYEHRVTEIPMKILQSEKKYIGGWTR